MARSRPFAVASLASLSRPAALALASAAVLLSACSGMGGMGMGGAGNMPPTVKVAGGALTDPQGLTLYVFDRDMAAGNGKSVCNAACTTNWPPLMAAPGTSAMGDYSVITRDDGARQWAYRGRPLYRFAKDAKSGDRMGDNFNNMWHVATP